MDYKTTTAPTEQERERLEQYSRGMRVFNDMCEINRAFREGEKELKRQYMSEVVKLLLKGFAAILVNTVMLTALYVLLTY